MKQTMKSKSFLQSAFAATGLSPKPTIAIVWYAEQA